MSSSPQPPLYPRPNRVAKTESQVRRPSYTSSQRQLTSSAKATRTRWSALQAQDGVRHLRNDIGLGSFSSVYRATKLTAEKVPHIGASESSFDTEADIYERLGDHPLVTPYYGRPSHGGIRLAYMDGGSLYDFLQRFPDAVPALRYQWILDVIEAVEYVHSKGIVVVNICSSNILIDSGSLRCKIADFGGSSIDGSCPEIQEGPTHAFPRPIDLCHVKTDVFALGHTLLEILVGEHPFSELETRDIQERYLNEEFPPVEGGLADSIIGCWYGYFRTAALVLESVRGALVGHTVGLGGLAREAALGEERTFSMVKAPCGGVQRVRNEKGVVGNVSRTLIARDGIDPYLSQLRQVYMEGIDEWIGVYSG